MAKATQRYGKHNAEKNEGEEPSTERESRFTPAQEQPGAEETTPDPWRHQNITVEANTDSSGEQQCARRAHMHDTKLK